MIDEPIRLAKRDDLDSLLELYAEMDAHWFGEKGASSGRMREGVEEALFGPVPSAESLIARRGGRIVGLMIFSVLFPGANVTTTAFIMELYVSAACRGMRIGRFLMKAMAQLALDRNYSRIEWTTDVDNETARAFYGQYLSTEKQMVFYRMERSALQELVVQDGTVQA